MVKTARKKRGRLGSILSWSFSVLLILVIVTVIVYAGLRKTEPPAEPEKKLTNVEVITIKPQEYRETLSLPARVEADRKASVSAEFAGILARWLVSEGAFVEKDQIVAELDTETLLKSLEEMHASLKTAAKNISLARIGKESAQVGLANATKQAKLQELAIKAARSDRKLAKTEFERIQALVRKKVMDPSKLDTARNADTQAQLAVQRAIEALESANLGIRTAEVGVKEAKANLGLVEARMAELEASIDSLHIKLEKTKLKAPISGNLEEYLVQPGETVGANAPLAHIYDLRYVRATVNVPDRYVAFLDVNNPTARTFIQMNMPGAEQQLNARLVLLGIPKLTGENGSGIEFKAEIARIAQAADPTSNTYRVELRLPNPGGVLRHGILARGEIEYLYYPHAIVIPVKAVQVTDEGPRVLVVQHENGGDRVDVRTIEPVSIRGDRLLVGHGLSEGEHLVTAGWKGLVAGESVNVLVENGQINSHSQKPAPIQKES